MPTPLQSAPEGRPPLLIVDDDALITDTLAYALGALIVPSDNRAAAFGWLAMGVQFGTAASPLVTGALAAVSIPGAYLLFGGLAWAGAGLLAVGGRGLRSYPERAAG